MGYFIKGMWERISFCLLKQETKMTGDSELIKQTLQEINHAWDLFSIVEDLDLIDYAIYSLKAAETKHNYLVKQLKKRDEEGCIYQ